MLWDKMSHHVLPNLPNSQKIIEIWNFRKAKSNNSKACKILAAKQEIPNAL